VQLLVNLYATSLVTSAAHEGALLVATGDEADGVGAQRRETAHAERRVRELLGDMGDDAALEWGRTPSDEVTLRVRVRTPRFLLPGLQTSLGFDEVDRTVQVRSEKLR
jgi:hypothetical protein